jgi:cysteine dioxygenase
MSIPAACHEKNMERTLDVHPLKSRVADFVAGLKTLEKSPTSSERVIEYISQMQPSYEALSPYVLWDGARYTRNLIYRDDSFEVLALCWLPGQRTPIHSHNGQLGWMTVVQGELACHNYRFVRSETLNKAPEPARKNADLGRPVEVEILYRTSCQADGKVTAVDRRQTTHQLENREKSAAGSVSLHVYSKPIDSCVLFDEGTRCCQRRSLQYYSANGMILCTTRPVGEQAGRRTAA